MHLVQRPLAGRASAWPKVLAIAGAFVAVEMAVSSRYGFHRDELYFLDCARHLQASYVDQPVLTPLLARITLDLFGVSVVALRAWSALAGAITICCSAALAREFGGSARSQVIAAAAAALSPALFVADHLFDTTGFDLLMWTVLALVLVRLGRTGDQRLWVAAGVVLGFGLANKHSIAFFAAAFVLALALGPGRALMRSRWFLLGAATAIAFTVPDIWWQAGHEWATFSMTASLNRENGSLGNVPNFLAGQLVMAVPVLIPVWWAGLRSLLRAATPTWRALAWTYPILFVLFMLTAGDKPYYLAGAYLFLLPAGIVALESGGAGSYLTAARGIAVWVAVGLGIAAFILPLIPARDATLAGKAYPDAVESIGWPELDRTVSHAWRALTPSERTNGVIFTVDYGEAGAINELGAADGLPTAISTQNSEWWWGPLKPNATTVLAVVPGPEDVTGYEATLRRSFGVVRQVATLTNAAGVHNQEWHGHIYLCRDPRGTFGSIWPTLRHYS